MSIVQQIKDRLDIVSYVQQYAPDLKRAGRYYKACCPFHGEKTPSFIVNPDTQSWRCFGACAEGGDVLSFAMKKNGWSFSEATRELAQMLGLDLPKRDGAAQADDARQDKLRAILKIAAESYHRALLSDYDEHCRAALAYVTTKRGFTHETLVAFQIGYAPPLWNAMQNELKALGYTDADMLEAGILSQNEQGNSYDRFRNRLMIPIRDERGRVVGFGARALADDDKPKYLNSPQSPVFDKSHLLFGLDRAKPAIREGETVVIVEGYMDAIQAHQAGFRNVVAQMGTALTEAQLRLLVPKGRAPLAQRLILALDADAAGQSATRRSLEVAREALAADYGGQLGIDIRILHIEGAKDPDDILRETPQLWQAAVDAAQPVADFVIALELAQLPADANAIQRQGAAQRLLPILTATENNSYRQENLQKLALRLRLPLEDVLDWAAQSQREAAKRQAQKAKLQAAAPPSAPPAPRPAPTPAAMDEMPPAWEGMDVSSSDEPPPLFGDERAAPPAPSPALPPTPLLTSRHSSRAAEHYCLRLLLKDPYLVYTINRKLRELAQGDGRLLESALGQLLPADFSQEDYKLLLSYLLEALDQDDLDIFDYIAQQLEPSLLAELMALRDAQEETLLSQQLLGRFARDMETILERQALARAHKPDELLVRILKVREARLKRENDELLFLLQEAQHDILLHLAQQAQLNGMALGRIQAALADEKALK